MVNVVVHIQYEQLTSLPTSFIPSFKTLATPQGTKISKVNTNSYANKSNLFTFVKFCTLNHIKLFLNQPSRAFQISAVCIWQGLRLSL